MMYRGLFVIVLLVGVTNAFSINHFWNGNLERNDPYRQTLDQLIRLEWNEYKLTFNKTYLMADEDELRLNIFIANKKTIDEHNSKYALGLSTYKMGVNQFTDLLDSEMDFMHGHIAPAEEDRNGIPFISSDGYKAAASVDWRKKGAVTPVRQQGGCGACWAFAAADAIASHSFIKKKGNLTVLSPQHLVDCVYKSSGCKGGSSRKAFRYVIDNKGIDTERAYRYKAKYNAKCLFNKNGIGATIKSYYNLKRDEKNLMNAVSLFGPVAVEVDFRHGMNRYKNGIFHSDKCSQTVLSHALLIVGYGTENGVDYWLAKNSWGTKWGENGYIKVARNRNNNCGIASAAAFPKV